MVQNGFPQKLHFPQLFRLIPIYPVTEPVLPGSGGLIEFYRQQKSSFRTVIAALPGVLHRRPVRPDVKASESKTGMNPVRKGPPKGSGATGSRRNRGYASGSS